MRQTPCTYDDCPEPILGRLRKYCRTHSRQASAIWKRQHPEWRTPWKKTDEERRAYFREYMRRYRQRHRTPKTDSPEGGEAVCSRSN